MGPSFSGGPECGAAVTGAGTGQFKPGCQNLYAKHGSETRGFARLTARTIGERLKRRRARPERVFFFGREGSGGGADSRNRTVDPIITNDVLYQLS
jgi:hypothetical protein